MTARDTCRSTGVTAAPAAPSTPAPRARWATWPTTTDPGADAFTVAAASGGSVGTVSNLAFDPATGSGGFDVAFSDGPATTAVSVQVRDSDGATSNVASIDVAVANVPPTLTISG